MVWKIDKKKFGIVCIVLQFTTCEITSVAFECILHVNKQCALKKS